MDTRKMEKITALVISTIVVGLSFFKVWDWQTVGIYAGSDIAGRVLYPFFHANILHASLNSWCLLSIYLLLKDVQGYNLHLGNYPGVLLYQF